MKTLITDRQIRILSAVAGAGRAMSLADLAESLQLPKPTLHRLCAQLAEQGLLLRDIDTRSFVVGPALHALALDVLNHGYLRGLRHRVLSDLVDDVGETCNFTTLDGAEVLYLDRVEARWPLRLTLDVGSRVPMHCTASGKLFLAHLPAREAQALIGHLRLDAYTPKTITDAKALNEECERIVRLGYSMDREEFVPGLFAVAVPVRDRTGTVRAAIATHAPVARMDEAAALDHCERLREAAKAMGALL